MRTILLFFLLCLCSHAEILRLSKVVPKPGTGITRHEFGDEEKQIILVEDKGFISEKDIEIATPSQSRGASIDITLTEAGGNKMVEATATMRPAIDRIAIIIHGKVKSAPVVQSVPLGRNFVINGLIGKDEPLKLAALLSGKSEEEVEEHIAKVKERIAALPKTPPPVYYTDEEYQELTAGREKVGLHYMDRLYTKEELNKLLTPGMILADVTGIFGKARQVSRKANGDWEMTFETASEKFPLEKEYRMDSFIAKFSDGKLVSWRPSGYSEMTRTPKPRQSKPQPTNLISKTPPADMSSEDFDIIRFIERHEITLKDGEREPTKADISGLMNGLYSLSSASDDGKGIDSQCDIVSIVALKIPEISALAKKHKNGKIPFSALNKAIKPYVFGDKPLP